MPPQIHRRALLTLVCEAGLEASLVRDFATLGAHGYTITDARGRGAHGTREGSWSPSANIRVEILCDESTAVNILAHVQRQYYAHYGMVAFLAEVEVLRPEKF